MKELLVIRHGKSSWDDPSLADHDRPLAGRGREAAPEMGRRLRLRGVVPERLVTSDAVRARDTAAALGEALGLGPEAVLLEPRLYTGSGTDVLAVVRRLDEAYERIGIVGHNPALHEFLHAASHLRLDKFPTAAVAHLRFPARRWSDIEPGSADVVDYDYPKSGRD
jgi:phosphohistidine phosphatase